MRRRAFLHTFVVFLYLLSVLSSSYATEFYFFFDIVSLNSLLFDWTRFDTRDHLSTFFLSSELLQNKDRKAHTTKSTKTRKALESSITVCVFFGEIALLKETPRVATVAANSFCELLVLRKADFEELLVKSPQLKEEIEKVAAARLS